LEQAKHYQEIRLYANTAVTELETARCTAEEGVQTYGGSYSSVSYFRNIRNEIGVMRLPCNEIAMRLHHWMQQRSWFKWMCRNNYCDNPIRFGAMDPWNQLFHGFGLGWL